VARIYIKEDVARIYIKEDVARIYIKEVFIRYRALIKVILDRDLRFIAVF